MPESAPVEMKQRRQISEEFDRLARERFDPQSMDKRVRADVALGFLPASAIGKIRMFTLADVGIAGSYDPETKKVVVMNDIEGGDATTALSRMRSATSSTTRAGTSRNFASRPMAAATARSPSAR